MAAVERLGDCPRRPATAPATPETLLKAFSIRSSGSSRWPDARRRRRQLRRRARAREPGAVAGDTIGTGQVLFGKLAAAVVPAVFGTWLGVLVFWMMTLLSRSPLYPKVLVADLDWLFSLVVMAPLVALFTAGVAALISTRVSGYRVAYQLNGLIVLPVVLLLIPATAFLFLVSGAALLYVAALFGLLDVGVVWWSRRLFTRERLLSRR